MILKFKFSILFLLISLFTFSQRGKDGDYTVGTLDTYVNTYTELTAQASSGVSAITVADNKMNSSSFSGDLEAGDLLLIYHVQGTYVDVSTEPITQYNGNYTYQESKWNGTADYFSPIEYGAVTNYWSAGKYEFAEVKSVSGNHNIELTCPLDNTYYTGDNDHPQVVRIPRYKNLTVPSNTSITSSKWDGTTGGVVAIEVEEDLEVTGSGEISANESGFRGGTPVDEDEAAPGPGTPAAIADTTSRGFLGSPDPKEGSGKGESIYGNVVDDYTNILLSPYGYGSIANGGGGGGYHNAGGGGGSNVGVGSYYSYGVVDHGISNVYDPAWNLEGPDLVNKPSSGGGRGGYSHSKQDKDPLSVGPHNSLWDSDYRRISGGVGGHPLTYESDRVFMGGGGGAGHGNDGYGGDGGNGGGVVLINVYGEITGDGTISANGAAGGSSEGPDPNIGQKTGEDGAGGAGGGGAIVIKNINAFPSTLKLEAKGGEGGDEIIKYAFGVSSSSKEQADGPGGGGAGGLIAFSTGTPTQNVTGGESGITTSSTMDNFPMNGATGGAEGMESQLTHAFDIIVENDTICEGENTTLTATIIGNPVSTPTLSWYASYSSTSVLHTGTSFTTPNLNTITTYYVGTCDAEFRVPVEVFVSPEIVISGVPPTISDANCNQNNGSITGIIASGGTGDLSFDWNGNSSPSEDLNNAIDGDYTLTISDETGCSKIVGPFTIDPTDGPVIDQSGISYTAETCSGNDGSITGITVNGGTSPYTYKWNGNTSPGLDLTGVNSGIYNLTVIDVNNCTSTAGPFIVTSSGGPEIDVTGISISDETCDENDGSITGIIADHGTGSLTYSWSSSGGNNLDITNADAGAYYLTVTDDNNCTTTGGPYTINESIPPTIDDSGISISDISCNATDGKITGITVSGGAGTLTYSWSPTGGNNLDVTNAGAGDYSLTVTDNANCTASSGSYTIGSTNGPVIDDVGISIINETCQGNDGSITGITVSGGSTPYIYEWNGGIGTSIDTIGAQGGVFNLKITDANGCFVTSGPYNIGASPGPKLDETGVNTIDESCTGNDGSITGITVSEGTSPYIYEWNGTVSSSIDTTGTTGGVYTLVVTDDNGCKATSSPYTLIGHSQIIIDEDAMDIVDETCDGNNGSITGITATGGSGTLTYSWAPSGGTGLDLTGVTADDYRLVVTDNKGCTEESGPYTVNLIPPPSIDDLNVNITATDCGLDNGSITGIKITGGTAPFSYDWNGFFSTGTDFEDIADGIYNLTVTDNNGCVASAGPYTINGSTGITIDDSGVQITDETCNGSEGSITGISITNGTSPFTYYWNGNTSASTDLNNVPSGSYTFVVEDASGCSDTAGPFVINAPTAPSVDVLTSNQAINEGESVQINTSVSPTNATVNWSPIEGLSCLNCKDPIATPSESTWYIITATSGNGCTDQDSLYIEIKEPCGDVTFPTAFSPNGDGLNDKFCVLGDCIYSMKLEIYNRWGEIIFESNATDDCWDGTYRGKMVNTGVYVYKFMGTMNDGDRMNLSGNVNVIR